MLWQNSGLKRWVAAESYRTLHIRMKIAGKRVQSALERSEGVWQVFLCLSFPSDTSMPIPLYQSVPISACLCVFTLSPSLLCSEEGGLGLRACGPCVQSQRESGLGAAKEFSGRWRFERQTQDCEECAGLSPESEGQAWVLHSPWLVPQPSSRHVSYFLLPLRQGLGLPQGDGEK